MMAPSIPSFKYKQRTISAIRTYPLGCGRPPPPQTDNKSPPPPQTNASPEPVTTQQPISQKPKPDAFFFNRTRFPQRRTVSATRTFPTGCGRPDSTSPTPEVDPTPSKKPDVCFDIVGFQEKGTGSGDETEALRVEPLRVDATFREPEALHVEPLRVDATFGEPEALRVEPLRVDATFRETEALRVEPLSVDATFRETEALRVEPLRVDATYAIDESDEDITERVPRPKIAGKSQMEHTPYRKPGSHSEMKKSPMMQKRGMEMESYSRGKHGLKMSGSESNKRRLSVSEVERERAQSGSRFDGKGEEVVGDRMIVQCLMNAKSCPWRVGELSRTPRVQSGSKAAGKGSGSVANKDPPSGVGEVLGDRMIVQCLMNAANCPWRSGRKSNTPKQAR